MLLLRDTEIEPLHLLILTLLIMSPGIAWAMFTMCIYWINLIHILYTNEMIIDYLTILALIDSLNPQDKEEMENKIRRKLKELTHANEESENEMQDSMELRWSLCKRIILNPKPFMEILGDWVGRFPRTSKAIIHCIAIIYKTRRLRSKIGRSSADLKAYWDYRNTHLDLDVKLGIKDGKNSKAKKESKEGQDRG